LNKQFLIKRILPVLLGMIAGYAYYYFIGCNNGHCMIQSNPYLSILYGGAIGLIFAIPSKKKVKENVNGENN
jgi:xanthine/uracil permease